LEEGEKSKMGGGRKKKWGKRKTGTQATRVTCEIPRGRRDTARTAEGRKLQY